MIRRAQKKDMQRINDLLYQVNMVHHIGRPDLFNIGKKYTDEELVGIINDDMTPILVWTDENDVVQGYAFCQIKQFVDNNIMTDIKTCYIDDLCVEENCRGLHIGSQLYDAVCEYAKNIGCYNVTLNVWALNDSAQAFYEHCGLTVQKIGMEHIL